MTLIQTPINYVNKVSWMTHKVVQGIKLLRHKRKSHEMISVTGKCIPTTVNKQLHKNEHSHEMTRFWNQIAVWSSLHEPVLIYGSSHGPVFESPLYRVHNEHESGSGPGLLQRSGSHQTIPKCSGWFTAHWWRLWQRRQGPRRMLLDREYHREGRGCVRARQW